LDAALCTDDELDDASLSVERNTPTPTAHALTKSETSRSGRMHKLRDRIAYISIGAYPSAIRYALERP
jgi:hypothetical protein